MKRDISREDCRKLLDDLTEQIVTPFGYLGKTYNSFNSFCTLECFFSVGDNARFLYEKIELPNGQKLKLPTWYIVKYSHLFNNSNDELDKLNEFKQEALKGVSQEDHQQLRQDIQAKFTTPFEYFGQICNSLDDLFKSVPFEGFCSRADNVRYLYEHVELLNGIKPELPLWYTEKYSHLLVK